MARDRRQYTPVEGSVVWKPKEFKDAFDGWTYAEGTKPVEAVAYLLLQSGIIDAWPDFQFSVDRSIYRDPEDPQPTPYPVARVLDWARLANDIPFELVGKRAFSLFVFARMLKDRNFPWCLNDVVEGMDPDTQRIALHAFALFTGNRNYEPWSKK